MDGKYVSDDAYKKGQKFFKKIRTILLIVAAVFLVCGIVMIVFGSLNGDGVMPNMGLLMPGIFLSFLALPLFFVSITLTVTMHKRELLAYNVSATIPVAGEAAQKGINFAEKNSDKLANVAGKIIGGAAKGVRQGLHEENEKQVVCPKCQYKNDRTDKFCGGCGEKLELKKYCAKCGEEVKAKNKFCASCGTKIE